MLPCYAFALIFLYVIYAKTTPAILIHKYGLDNEKKDDDVPLVSAAAVPSVAPSTAFEVPFAPFACDTAVDGVVVAVAGSSDVVALLPVLDPGKIMGS